jgi:transmembrane sensor
MDIYKLRKIFSRYYKGKTNETENALVEAWYRSYASDEQVIQDDEVNRIQKSIRDGINKRTQKWSITFTPAFHIAASLLVISVISFFTWSYFNGEVLRVQRYTTISTGRKGLKELHLPDGSNIWLNAASRIRIPEAFTGKLREVVLEEGEAYFEITRDPTHPFIVHTSPVSVQVLGTSFNIRAYKKLQSITVSVATGKVGVKGKLKTLAMLLPGQQLSYNVIDGQTTRSTINIGQAESWKKGYTYLNQASFKELSVIVKNIYGLSLRPANKHVGDYRFSLRLMHHLQQQQVLELISQLHHTLYRREGNDIILY